jgi:hypothetical protein
MKLKNGYFDPFSMTMHDYYGQRVELPVVIQFEY